METRRDLSKASIPVTQQEINEYVKTGKIKLTELLKNADQQIAEFTAREKERKKEQQPKKKERKDQERMWAYCHPNTVDRLEIWARESGMHKGLVLDVLVNALGEIPFSKLKEAYLDRLGVSVKSISPKNERDKETTDSSTNVSSDS